LGEEKWAPWLWACLRSYFSLIIIFLEEFDELVLDGKVEKVRELLLVNGQKSFLDLNRCDDLGKALVHKVLFNILTVCTELISGL